MVKFAVAGCALRKSDSPQSTWRRRALTSALGLAVALAPSWAGAERILLWPRTPGQAARAGRISLDKGYTRIPFAPLAARLRAARRRLQERTREALSRVASAREKIQRAYLEQRWDVMVAQVEDLLSRELALLARPAQRDTLWQLQLQAGIAYLYRGHDRDEERARERFQLALAIDIGAKPSQALYSPEVTATFAEVRADFTGRTPRPVEIELTPQDAQVTIDGQTLGIGSDTVLRPGLHVVLAAAPGFVAQAEEIDTDERPLAALKLIAGTQRDSAESLAPVWARGGLQPERESTRRLVWNLARELAVHAVVVCETSEAGARAWRIDGKGVQKASAATLEQAVRTALGSHLELASSRPTESPTGALSERPFYNQGWFWWSVVGVSVGAVAVAIATSTRAPRRVIVDIASGP